MNLEQEFKQVATGLEFEESHNETDIDSFLEDCESIMKECLPQIREVLMDKFKPYLESKMGRVLTECEVRHIIKTQLEPLTFNIAELL